MMTCHQTDTQTIWEHGISVMEHYADLYMHFKHGDELKLNWRLPEWIDDAELWDRQICYSRATEYQIHHDCGKPFCLEIDDNGKRHFPNHAQVSYDTWIAAGGSELIWPIDSDGHGYPFTESRWNRRVCQ